MSNQAIVSHILKILDDKKYVGTLDLFERLKQSSSWYKAEESINIQDDEPFWWRASDRVSNSRMGLPGTTGVPDIDMGTHFNVSVFGDDPNFTYQHFRDTYTELGNHVRDTILLTNIAVDSSKPMFPISYVTRMSLTQTVISNDSVPTQYFDKQKEILLRFDGVDLIGSRISRMSPLKDNFDDLFLTTPRFRNWLTSIFEPWAHGPT